MVSKQELYTMFGCICLSVCMNENTGRGGEKLEVWVKSRSIIWGFSQARWSWLWVCGYENIPIHNRLPPVLNGPMMFGRTIFEGKWVPFHESLHIPSGFWVTMAPRSRPRLVPLFCITRNACLGPSSTVMFFFFSYWDGYWLRKKGRKGIHVFEHLSCIRHFLRHLTYVPSLSPTGLSPMSSSPSHPRCCLLSPGHLISYVDSYSFLHTNLTSFSLASL